MNKKIKVIKLSKEEKRKLEEGEAEIKRGEYCTFDDLKKGIKKKKRV